MIYDLRVISLTWWILLCMIRKISRNINQEASMSEQQIQKVKVRRLAHVGLWATDVATQARFYRQVLGFDLRATELSATDPEIELEVANAFLALSDEHHCLALFNDTRPP